VVAAWDSADIASHQRAADALDLCKDGLFSAMQSRLGMGVEWNEVEAQQHLVRLMQEHGLEFDHPPIVAVNRHAGDPHYAPVADRALPIKHGDLVLCDVWAREKERVDGGVGAYADITWMATAADPTPGDHERIWETVRSARDAAVAYIEDQVADGEPVAGCEVDRVARGVIDKAGYGKAYPPHRPLAWLGGRPWRRRQRRRLRDARHAPAPPRRGVFDRARDLPVELRGAIGDQRGHHPGQPGEGDHAATDRSRAPRLENSEVRIQTSADF
jgi:hypothetical protein